MVKFLLFFLAFLITMNTLLMEADAFIYANATNNADTFLRQNQTSTNYGSSDYLGIYGIGNKMTTVMNWTLPNGSGDIKSITLNMYCKKWDYFPATPVELHVLREGFNESTATWNNKTSTTKWNDPGAWIHTSSNSRVVDKVLIDKDGIYTWVLKGQGAENSQDSLTWNKTINLSLILPNEKGWGGVQCYSKENAASYYRPYIIVTDENITTPGIINITNFKVKKTSALVLSNSDVNALARINYGTNISNLDKWSEYDTPTRSPHNILTSLSPNTIYYYNVYMYNYIDTNQSTKSQIFSFRTKEDTTAHVPLVTFVFDDGLKSVYTRAFPILGSSLFPGVTSVISSNVKGYPNYMNLTELETLQNTYNWEIASHTVTHPDLKLLNDTRLDYELYDSKNTLQSYGFNVHNFISPYGSYNARTEAHIMKYYDSDRSTFKENIPNDSEYPLPGKSIWNTTTPDEAKTWVDEAINNNSWLIFVFHNIADYYGHDSAIWIEGEWTTNDLTELVKYIESKGKIRVVTIREAQTMSFDYKGIYAGTATKILTNKIYTDGNINYNKTVTGHKKVNMMVLPSFDYVNVTIFNWLSSGNYYKRWSESSINSSVSASHLIGDFPANTSVQIKKDGYDWKTLTSNASGIISFVYDEPYGDHQFETSVPQQQQAPRLPEGPAILIVIGGVIAVVSGLMLMASKINKK